MRDQPADVDDDHLTRALADWGIEAASLAYAPVGYGDHHWAVDGIDGTRWFVTVADLRRKAGGPVVARTALDRALRTATALSADLDAVLAPVRTPDGEVLGPLGSHHVLAVFPFVEHRPHAVDHELPPQDLERLVDTLAALHAVDPPGPTPRLSTGLANRRQLESGIRGAGSGPWSGGPFAEPARRLLERSTDVLRRRLDELDRRTAAMGEHRLVVTHGEPHPGNVLVAGDDHLLLVDWDTVGLAVPERDLWMLAGRKEALARYEASTGHVPDPDAMAVYPLRWDLDEVAAFTTDLRGPHGATPDAETAWESLRETVARLGDASG